MSVYFVRGKGWRYDFSHNRQRHTAAWFATKRQAACAEAEKRKEVQSKKKEIPTDMGFLELVNRRLDHVQAYCCQRHYADYRYMARRWVSRWGHLPASQISAELIEQFVLQRRKVSAFTANKEIRYLRALFNFGIKKKLVTDNPVVTEFFPTEKRYKYVPAAEDVSKVISVAEGEDRDYIEVIRETMARVGEINRLTWDDVDLESRCVVLYTRKKRGGHLTPRPVPMTGRVFEILSRRYSERDRSKPWVFWHSYTSSKTGARLQGPYQDRKKLMQRLCAKAGVRYFRFHALRHSGASLMDNSGVPIGVIQRILGHENRKTTEIYLHGLGEMERQAMAIFEQASRKSLTQVSHGREGSVPTVAATH